MWLSRFWLVTVEISLEYAYTSSHKFVFIFYLYLTNLNKKQITNYNNKVLSFLCPYYNIHYFNLNAT